MCSFGSGFGVRVFSSSSGFRDKVFFSLSQVPDPGCVSFPGSGFRVRVLGDRAIATDLPGVWVSHSQLKSVLSPGPQPPSSPHPRGIT